MCIFVCVQKKTSLHSVFSCVSLQSTNILTPPTPRSSLLLTQLERFHHILGIYGAFLQCVFVYFHPLIGDPEPSAPSPPSVCKARYTLGPSALKRRRKKCTFKELYLCNRPNKALKCVQTFSHYFFALVFPKTVIPNKKLRQN